MGGQGLITRLYLFRHAESEAAEGDRFAGEIDVPLSERGREQARRLGDRLAGEPIRAVYSSPLSRALDTARPIADRHGLKVVPRPELREISHGRWEGLPRVEVASRYPEELARWDRDPFGFAPEGGETGLAVTARALPAVLTIVDAHAGGCAAVVSHKATIRLLVCALIGLDPRRYRDRLDLKPAALTVLDFRGTADARLMAYNEPWHVAPPDSGLPDPG